MRSKKLSRMLDLEVLFHLFTGGRDIHVTPCRSSRLNWFKPIRYSSLLCKSTPTYLYSSWEGNTMSFVRWLRGEEQSIFSLTRKIVQNPVDMGLNKLIQRLTSMRGIHRESYAHYIQYCISIGSRVWPFHDLSPEERRSTKVRIFILLICIY